MELHALGRQLAMAQAHHHAAAARGLLQAGGQLRVDDQRVVAPHRQRRGQPGEDRAPVVLDGGGLAVDGRVQHDAPAEGLGERLVAEAHAERGDARLGQAPHHLERDPGLIGSARPGRDNAALVARPASSSSTLARSLRTTSTSAPSSPRYWTRL